MFDDGVYKKIADEFATPIGVADLFNSPNNMDGIEISTSVGRNVYRQLNDEYRINNIINMAIRYNKYHALSRLLVTIKQKKPKISERELYSTAWRKLNGKTNKTKRTKVQS